MSIRELKNDANDMDWLEGKFDSISLFKGEMNITIFHNSEEAVSYAEECVKAYNSLNNDKALLDDIQEQLAKFLLYMNDEWKAMDIFEDIAANTQKVVDGYNEGRRLIEYLSRPRLYVELPDEENFSKNDIGYVIEAECPWEPEHQCSIIIRNGKLKYVGPSEGNTPWDDDEDYYYL